MENKFFTNSKSSYYNMLKKEFLPLIPEGPNIILDIGCGAGQLGRVLREMNKAAEIVGVEIYAPAAEEAKKDYNKVYCDNIESLTLPYGEHFDYIICGDILEHLIDPWAMLSKINRVLKKGGALICCIPNIRYWKIISNLLVGGNWEYAEAGILDATHLRFFTKRSFIKMLNDANYRVTWLHMSISGKKKVANKITFGVFSEFLAPQIMISARKD